MAAGGACVCTGAKGVCVGVVVVTVTVTVTVVVVGGDGGVVRLCVR
jgi:hypothetical protein